jgi:hypothetical protein
MLAAHSSSVAKALAGIDGSAKAAAAIGATVRSVVQTDVFFSVLKAGDWGEMALRIVGRLLLGGESNEPFLVVAPTEAESTGNPEAVIWLQGGGVGRCGYSPMWLSANQVMAAAAFGSFGGSLDAGAPFGGREYTAVPTWSPDESRLLGVQVTIGSEAITTALAAYCKVALITPKRLLVGPEADAWERNGWSSLISWDLDRMNNEGCPAALGGARLGLLLRTLIESTPLKPCIAEVAVILASACQLSPPEAHDLAAYLYALVHFVSGVEVEGSPPDLAAGCITQAIRDPKGAPHQFLTLIESLLQLIPDMHGLMEASREFAGALRNSFDGPQVLVAQAAHMRLLLLDQAEALDRAAASTAACLGSDISNHTASSLSGVARGGEPAGASQADPFASLRESQWDRVSALSCSSSHVGMMPPRLWAP